ncbi:MAG: rod shape-determining protein MreD [Treponema sp.]|jgi:rod shape-determining protein MreD|nr:rod shape-determining protein MreD [Treponema sp.]
MAKNVVWATVFIIVAALIQSTLLSLLTDQHITPDLTLGILVYSAYVNGTMTGQITGFFSGIFLDFLSASPLGLNTFIRTVIGALAGLIKGTFFLDAVVLPMALCATATFVRALMLFILRLLFGNAIEAFSFVEPVFWIELCLNTFTAPLLFGFLNQFKPLLAAGREK